MINGGESADKMVDYTLKFGDIILRLSGTAAKNLAAYLISLSKDTKKTRGKTRLVRMLKDGRELKIFQIKTDDLKKFALEAKRYGILFTALSDKKSKDGTVDLMVKLDDASKVNRVLERINLSAVDTGTIEATIEKDRTKANPIRGRVKESPSDPSLRGKNATGKATTSKRDEKPSVREALRKIKEQLGTRSKTPTHKYQQVRIHKPKAKVR